MADIEFNFEDNVMEVKRAAKGALDRALLEVSAELVSQTARNTPVKTGQLKSSWAANVQASDEQGVAIIGSPLEHSVWVEFGTGQYALNGDGRIGGWAYKDEETGETIWTHGSRPRRPLWNAYRILKNKIIKRIQEVFKEGMK